MGSLLGKRGSARFIILQFQIVAVKFSVAEIFYPVAQVNVAALQLTILFCQCKIDWQMTVPKNKVIEIFFL